MKLGRAFSIVFVLAASAAPAVAHAQDAAACKDGYDRSQVLRDEGKLLEAQKLLRHCSSASCSAFVQKECGAWLSDVEARLPSVILVAKDGAGADLANVAVSIDGSDRLPKLDGRAIDIDPGEHTFVFQLADGRKAQKRVLIREREAGTIVAVTIGAPKPAPAQSPPALPPVANTASPLRVAGFIVGGAGIAGLAIGTVFGLQASNKLSAPQCDTSTKVCDPGVIGDAESAARVSTIGFVAGGVLVAGGLTMVLVAPRGGTAAEPKTARVSAAPMIGINTGGLSVRGAW